MSEMRLARLFAGWVMLFALIAPAPALAAPASPDPISLASVQVARESPPTVSMPARRTGPRRHVTIPKGSVQVGWLLALPLLALIDVLSRRRRWTFDLVELWRVGLAFIGPAWRRMPAPLTLVVVGSLGTDAHAFVSAPLGGILEGAGGLALSVGYWLSFGAGYRLNLQSAGLPVSRPWQLKIGGAEGRLLAALAVVVMIAALGAFLSILVSDVVAALLRGAGGDQSSALLDRAHVHGAAFGVTELLIETAFATIWPMVMIGDHLSVKSALKVSWGAWLPIALSILPTLAIAAGVQILVDWAKADAQTGSGPAHMAALLIAVFTMPLVDALTTPFSVAISARRFQLLAPEQTEAGDLLSVFD